MATTTSYPSFLSPKIAVPITTALFGALGLTTGLTAFISPGPDVAKMFGISPPVALDPHTESGNRQLAYIRIHGIRNVGVGLSLLAGVSFWRFSTTCQSSPVAAAAMSKWLAIAFALSPVIGLGDSYILLKYLESDSLSSDARKLAKSQSVGHAVLTIPMMALAAGWWYL